MTNEPIRLAVLISGGGRTLVNLQEQIAAGKLSARIDAVVSSRGDVKGVERSRALGLTTVVIERRGLSSDVFQQSVTDAIGNADLVCMGGFLSLWRIPQALYGRVMNIHPALLPKYGGKGMYGMRVHEAVLAAGEKVSGCTVHFCDNEYDHGPIILQQKIPVLPDDTPDTLAARVFEQECIAYPEAVRLFAGGRIRIQEGQVEIT